MTFPYRFSSCALMLSTLTMSTTASAEDAFRQHDAHVHGVVEFNIAQDGKDLLMEITAPGADVVGFEHAPSNKQQQLQLEGAIAQLNNAGELIAFSSASNCLLTDVHVTETLTADEGHESHAGHDHDEHDHDAMRNTITTSMTMTAMRNTITTSMTMTAMQATVNFLLSMFSAARTLNS